MNTVGKIIPPQCLVTEREKLRKYEFKVIVTNGCFDILHSGHVDYLEKAASMLDDYRGHSMAFLLVGLNSDDSVRKLKGPTRPINNQNDRARVLAALECVDGVCIFSNVRATEFLKVAQPDYYVKGGDYTLETLDKDERAALEFMGTKITFFPTTTGKSTSETLAKIQLTMP